MTTLPNGESMPAKKLLANAGPPPIDESDFRDLMALPSVAREMFLPFGRARWEGGRYTLGRGERKTLKPTISGLRVQEPDPNNVDMHRERGCQRDLVAVIRSVAELRKTPKLAGVVLGNPKDVLVGTQSGQPYCQRVLFGLICPADGPYRSENEAAAECHRQIVAAGRKAQHDLRDEVPPYDPLTGFAGLLRWAEGVRWKRRRSPWWPLLLLLPLFFLPLMCYQVDPHFPEVDTDSLILIIDTSDTMEPCFPQLPKEAERFLTEFKERRKEAYIDVIFYNTKATSVLNDEIKKLDDDNHRRIIKKLYSVTTGGLTDLTSGLTKACEEVGRHKKKTTLLALTDGKQNDHPLSALKDDLEKNSNSSVMKLLNGTPAVMKWFQARLMYKQSRWSPNDDEKKWDEDMDGVTRAFNANVPGAGSGNDQKAPEPHVSDPGGGPEKGGGGGADPGGTKKKGRATDRGPAASGASDGNDNNPKKD